MFFIRFIKPGTKSTTSLFSIKTGKKIRMSSSTKHITAYIHNIHNVMVDGVFLNPSVIVVITHASVITYPPGETYTTNTIYIMHTHYHGYIDNDIFLFIFINRPRTKVRSTRSPGRFIKMGLLD